MNEPSRITIGGIDFVQAITAHGTGIKRWTSLDFTSHGEPRYGFPGGERLTEAQIKARIGDAKLKVMPMPILKNGERETA